jgi:5-methylcytosine-specific restriction endonuclease McrA
MCEEIEGVIVPAAVIDHINPIHTGEEERATDPSNLMSLCAVCHSKKTRNPNYLKNKLHGIQMTKELMKGKDK